MTRPSGGAEPGARRSRLLLASVLVAALTAVVFAPSLGHGFVNYDDDGYVYENAHVLHGLGDGGWQWALTATDEWNWHPLTWWSLMLDAEIHGLRGDVAPFEHSAHGFHATNVLLHVANAVLLLWILSRLTGSVWGSALVAALFGVHPLHVESVAWVAERKDVLSTLFGLLSIGAYARWAASGRVATYAWALAFLALGLMSKPMLVTLPLVFLLLDLGPLRRGSEGAARLLREKVPFLAAAAASSVVTLLVQHRGGSVRTLESLGPGIRAANAAVSAVRYLAKTLWPADLAVFYPHPGDHLPAFEVAGALLLLAGVTLAAVRLRRRCPYLAFGWLFYLVTLAPVLGLVQVGSQAMADRYTYLPLVGIFVAAVFSARDAVRAGVLPGGTLSAAAVLVLGALAWRARVQVGTWKDSETLFRHALLCTSGNHVAHTNLGAALSAQGRNAEAIPHFESAIAIEPGLLEARVDLGRSLLEEKRVPEAIECLEEAVRRAPDDAEAQNNLGVALALDGRVKESIEHLQKAVDLAPGRTEWRGNLDRARSLGRRP